MSKIVSRPFGKTADGRAATLYCMENDNGMQVSITDFGGAVVSLVVPDREGNPVDVVLGYDNATVYEQSGGYLGALIGRYGNRIGGGAFLLNGKKYQLYCNEGANHLHGGKSGFDHKLWDVQPSDGKLLLRYTSLDGEEGYPGALQVTVQYSLLEDNTLSIQYTAVSDQDTVCNLTNHSYFNLGGHSSGTILEHKLRLNADCFTPTDAASIPTGEILPVEGTPLDFRELTTIGKGIDADNEQLRFAAGYDQNWIIRDADGSLREMAYAECPATGITMTAATTLPAVQFYAGNHLDQVGPGKGGVTYLPRGGFCLESQYYPDSMAHPDFPQPILRAGDTYRAMTNYRFAVKED